jgi:7-carboxy-7-deazaguanine synthase
VIWNEELRVAGSPSGRDWLLVSEIFTTIQGEGPSTGQRALFIRLGACNQHCTWCDTPYTWVFDQRHADLHAKSLAPFNPQEELKRMSVFQLRERILDENIPLIVITGGEPLLQIEPLASVISSVNEWPLYPPRRFEIETAGTVDPGALMIFDNVDFNVSPKLAHSGNELELRRNVPVLLRFSIFPRVTFKFVFDPETIVACTEEIEEIQALAAIPDHRVWIMPLGTDAETILRVQQAIAPQVIAHRWNLSTRLHVLIWGDERGR